MPFADPEKRKAYMKNWCAAHPDRGKRDYKKYADKQRQYRQSHLANYAEYQRQSRARNSKQVMVTSANGRAKRDGLLCDISIATLEWPTRCPVLGLELDYNTTMAGTRKARDNYPTLDRKDNTKGYVVGNVFVISHRANRIKSDATAAELQAIATYAALPNH